MSLITTCPACATSFRLRPEQLAVRGGDVRCGNCAHVFNALASLTEVSDLSAQPLADTPPSPAVDNFIVPDTGSGNIAHASVIGDEYAEPEPEPEPEPEKPIPSPLPFTPRSGRLFTMPRWFLLTILLLLLLMAFSQPVYHLRSQIAARFTAVRPLLHQLCSILDCKVALPMDARLLSIQDSDLHEDTAHPGTFVLSSTLSNRAPYPQAFPLLELTLTNTQDQPLLRRQLTPVEYLPNGTQIDLGQAGNSDMLIQIYFSTEQIQATGYRVYVSY